MPNKKDRFYFVEACPPELKPGFKATGRKEIDEFNYLQVKLGLEQLEGLDTLEELEKSLGLDQIFKKS
ncbi:hypothetical protein J4225_01340 [Candidatus Pacearchaeota archaeon]|nr:hypothetical protein [Candidatus Pacearchaeota archaeon]